MWSGMTAPSKLTSRSAFMTAYRTACLFLSQEVGERIVETVRRTEPIDHDVPGYGWTVPKIIC